MVTRQNCPPVGMGRAYVFEMGAASFHARLRTNPEAIPSDSEIESVFSLTQSRGIEEVLSAALVKHRRAAQILVNFSILVKGTE